MSNLLEELVNMLEFPASSVLGDVLSDFLRVISLDMNKLIAGYREEFAKSRCGKAECPICQGIGKEMFNNVEQTACRIRDILEPHKSEFVALFETIAKLREKADKNQKHHGNRNCN